MSRLRLSIALFGLLVLVQVQGKPNTVLPAETARELSSSGISSQSWYTDSQQNVRQEPTKSVFIAHAVGTPQVQHQNQQPAVGVETGRDSYVDAASSLGYSIDSGSGTSSQHHGQYSSGHQEYPKFGGPIGPSSVFKYSLSPTNGHSYGESSYINEAYDSGLSYRTDSESGGWLCRTFGGLCDDGQVDETAVGERDGTAPIGVGILGLVALIIKKIKLIPLLPLIIPLLPILLPIGLILLVPIVALSFFLPIVPVVVISNGRSMAVPWARAATEAITGEDCLERISCEAYKAARGYGYDAPWIKRFLEKTSPTSKWIERVSRGTRSTSECKKFTCKPMTSFQKALKIKSE